MTTITTYVSVDIPFKEPPLNQCEIRYLTRTILLSLAILVGLFVHTQIMYK